MWRTVTSWMAFTIATVLMPLALVANWGMRTVVDQERYVATVSHLAHDPVVQAAIAEAVNAGLEENVRLPADVTDKLPGFIQGLLPGLRAGIISYVNTQVERFVASPEFQKVWDEMNSEFQTELVNLLEGDTSGSLSYADGAVTLDLGSVITRVQSELDARGVKYIGSIPLPEVAKRSIVLFRSDSFDQVQRIFAIAKPLALYSLLLCAALFALAIALSGRRSRMVIATGVAGLLSGLVLFLLLGVSDAAINDATANSSFRPVADAVFVAMTMFLRNAVGITVALGTVLVFAGWFGGASESGAAVRNAVGGGLTRAGARAGEGPLAPVTRAGAVMARWIMPLRIGVIVLAVISVLVRERNTPGTLIWTAVVVVCILALLQFTAGIGTSGESDSRTEDSALPASM